MTEMSHWVDLIIACSNGEHTVRDIEGICCVSILPVAAADWVAGKERKVYYNTVQDAKAQATNPGEREVSSQLVLRNINIEDRLSESQREKLSTLLFKYQAHFATKTMQLFRTSIPVARWRAEVPKQQTNTFFFTQRSARTSWRDAYRSHYWGIILIIRKSPHLGSARWKTCQDMSRR